MTSEDFSRQVATLYACEAKRLQHLAASRLGNQDEAEDLVSESFRILTERGTLLGIGNPAAFLTTLVGRLVIASLRERYRLRLVPMEQAPEKELIGASDVALDYEESERASLVRESLEALSSSRQRRIVKLFSLNYKAGEIAQIESASGSRTTSHQVSCVLQGTWPNLRAQFRRRGLVPALIPASLAAWLRLRTARLARLCDDVSKLLDPAFAIQAIVAVGLAAALSAGGSSQARSTPLAPVAPGLPFFRHEPLVVVPSLGYEVRPPVPAGAVWAGTLGIGAEAPPVIAGSAPSKDPGREALPLPVPGKDPVAPISPAPNIDDAGSPNARLSLTPETTTEISSRTEHAHSDPLLQQVVALAEDPTPALGLECGGLPVCSASK